MASNPLNPCSPTLFRAILDRLHNPAITILPWPWSWSCMSNSCYRCLGIRVNYPCDFLEFCLFSLLYMLWIFLHRHHVSPTLTDIKYIDALHLSLAAAHTTPFHRFLSLILKYPKSIRKHPNGSGPSHRAYQVQLGCQLFSTIHFIIMLIFPAIILVRYGITRAIEGSSRPVIFCIYSFPLVDSLPSPS
jgi:hypothetical protein